MAEETASKQYSNLPLGFILNPHGYSSINRNHQLRSIDGNYLLNVTENEGNVRISSITQRRGLRSYQLAGNVERVTRKSSPIVSFDLVLASKDSHSPFRYADFEYFRHEYLQYVTKGAGANAVRPVVNRVSVENLDGSYYFYAELDNPVSPTNIRFAAEIEPGENSSFGQEVFEGFKRHFISSTTSRFNLKPEELVIQQELNVYERLKRGDISGIREERANALLKVFGDSSYIRKSLREISVSPDSKSTKPYEKAKRTRNTQAQIALTLAGKFLRDHPDFLNKKLSQPAQT